MGAYVIICPGGAYRHLSPRESEPVARVFREMGLETEILRYPVREAGDPEPLGLRPLHALADAVKGGRLPVPARRCMSAASPPGRTSRRRSACMGARWAWLRRTR